MPLQLNLHVKPTTSIWTRRDSDGDLVASAPAEPLDQGE